MSNTLGPRTVTSVPRTDDQILDVLNSYPAATVVRYNGVVELVEVREDAPLMTIEFHNDLAEKLTKEERVRLVNLMLQKVFT